MNKDFIPTRLGIGAGFRIFANDYNEIGIYADINKLLVPTPDTLTDDKGNFLYKQNYQLQVFSPLLVMCQEDLKKK